MATLAPIPVPLAEWKFDAIEASGDPRVASWLLVRSPKPLILLLMAYVTLVQVGPRFMRNLKPLKLTSALYVYNAFQVALSAYMVCEFVTSLYLAGFSFKCQRVDYSDNPIAMRMARVSWWYFFSKIIDLMDTVFFILRKKNNQISFLHVYHHTIMIIYSWLGVKYAAGGQVIVSAMLNSFVHTVMYTYYFLSALGPRVQPYLWWKKYLTQLQLVQFVLIILHTCVGVYNQCEYPSFLLYFLVAYALSLIVLFSNFYRKAYMQQKGHKGDRKTQ